MKLTLSNAILINLNVMLGAGIFINTVELSKRAGPYGGLLYLAIAVCVIPLMVTLAQLTRIYPSGGFYTYAQQTIGPFAGFISAWSYFVAKLASGTLMLHVALSLLQQIIIPLRAINIFALDIFVLTLFTALNLLDVRTGSRIQLGFLILKLVPITFVIVAGLYLFNPALINASPALTPLLSAIPLVLYATMGFEAICALTNQLENPQRDGPRAIIGSFTIVVAIVAIFQTVLYASVGPQLINQASYLGTFPTLLAYLLSSPVAQGAVIAGLNSALAASALGGFYGILFSNHWNLFILAQNHLIPVSGYLQRLNRHDIPTMTVLVQAVVCALYLLITGAQQLWLQQIAAMGVTIAYGVSIYALLKTRVPLAIKMICAMGIATCILIIGTALSNLIHAGSIIPLAALASLLGIGTVFYLTSRRT